jgi:hypothetical protein
VAVEAIFPKNSDLAKKVEGQVGQLDNTKYRDDQPLVVIQGHKKLGYDIYTNTAETLSQTKIKYDDKPDPLLKSALDSLNISLQDIESAGGGLYIKKALTYMIPASALNMENRTIDAGWGTQQVQSGGFLVLENYPNTTNIYCVNPDSGGNPTGYISGR